MASQLLHTRTVSPLYDSGVLMSFGMYLVGFIVVVLGLGYGAYLAHLPSQWIAVMVIVLIGLGILKGVTSTRQKDPN